MVLKSYSIPGPRQADWTARCCFSWIFYQADLNLGIVRSNMISSLNTTLSGIKIPLEHILSLQKSFSSKGLLVAPTANQPWEQSLGAALEWRGRKKTYNVCM